jgi:hypothetical protein
LLALKEIEDPTLWPSRGQFKNATVEPVALEEVMDVVEPRKKRKSEGGQEKVKKEVKKRRQSVHEMPMEAPKKARVSGILLITIASPKDRLLRLRMKLQMFLQQKDAYTVFLY